jgi:hypothetical protein
MPVRLPLLRVSAANRSTGPLAPAVRAPWALGVADAREGDEALEFAANLASELARGGLAVRLSLLAYDVLPHMADALGATLEQSAVRWSCHAVSARAEVEPAIDRPASQVTLLVGGPALASFRPALSILLGVARPLNEWPPFLLACRGSAHLELPQASLATARALAAHLLERGFLPRR